MRATLVDALGAVALVVTASTVLPQIGRLLRTGAVGGLSTSWVVLGAVSTAVWTTYLASGGLWWPAIADAICCVSYLVTLWLLTRHETSDWRIFAAGAAWAALFGIAAVTGGRPLVGVVLSIAFAVQVSPAVWTAYRAADVTGVSATTWLLIVAEGTLWGSYGFLEADLAVVAFGLIATAAATLMVCRVTILCGRAGEPPAAG